MAELTAANCGEKLLGVEQSVFARAGFVRLKDMPVTQDESLRRRLNALVTTGDPGTFTCNDGTGEKVLFTQFDTSTKTTIRLTKMTTGENAGSFVGSIDAEDLLDLLAIDSFVLDTIEKHTAFSAKVGTFGNIGVEITELPETP